MPNEGNLQELSTSALRLLANEPKFLPNGLYSGARPEEHRIALEQIVNHLILAIADLAPAQQTKNHVLGMFRATLNRLTQVDSEEKEQICAYLERTMKILGIESSDGILNTFVYGFDLQALIQARNSEA